MRVVTEGLGDKVAVVTLEIDGVKLRLVSQPLSKEEAAKVSDAGADVEVISVGYQQAVGRDRRPTPEIEIMNIDNGYSWNTSWKVGSDE